MLETFGLNEFDFQIPVETEESLQRTKEWLLKRKGCFTGSKISELMSCGRSTVKQSWGSVEKIVDFGEGAETRIYIVGKQRSSDVMEMEVTGKSLDYGTYFEPFLRQQLIDDGVITDFEELGFEYFGEYKNGGASADGRAIYIGNKFPEYKGKTVGIEMKCCTTWSGHKGRMYEPVNDKHKDFWQHQSEMLAMGVDIILYVVAEPMNIKKYDIQIVKASKIHQHCILQRCIIGDAAIELWENYSYKEALEIACANYKEVNTDKFI